LSSLSSFLRLSVVVKALFSFVRSEYLKKL
jgi:hypothetical protein